MPNEPTLCNRPTRHGTCKIALRNGKCLVHDADLSARNSKVAQAFKRNHPEAFSEQRSKAGHNGFMATGGKIGWEKANEKARQYRIEHPSNPEQAIIDALAKQSINHYQRELLVGDNLTVDFGWSNSKCAIECEGYRVGGFGDAETRRAKQNAKIQKLVDAGYTVLRYDPTVDSMDKVLEFARTASRKEETVCSDDLPF